VIVGHSLREGWQVVRPHLGDRLETGGQLDQRWLAERRAEEADARG
jgi:hypothetical protein